MFCASGTGKSSGSRSPRKSQDTSSKTQVPLLLHFDVNKTVIQSDSVQMKGVEEGIREGIADLFWGVVQKSGGTETWEWIKAEPSCTPPKDDILAVGTTPCNYTAWCKRAHGKDKKAMKEAVRSFSLVQGQPVETEMKKLLQLTIKKMQLPKEVRKSKEAEAAGLQGLSFNMFPAVFHLVAQLQRQRRPFGILFRSFGADHQKIQTEWNAFCELKHPIFSRLIEDLGPMDGSVPGLPDRRIHSIHTVYRDAHGPMILLDTFTNGPEDHPWDNWARTRPKPTNDSRNGKVWAKQVLKPRVVEGMMGFRKFCTDHLSKQATAAIKDDWAWWQFHSEQANAGKLMTLLRRKESAQVFFDDNIEPFDARIVDCRDEYDKTVADSIALEKYLVKVNPVEAMLDENYFWRKLLATQGDQVDVGASLFSVQKQLADAEEEKGALMKQNNRYCQQLKTLMEENRRMKQQRRIHVRDENDLHSILQKDGIDVKQFGTGRFKPLASLYAEIERESCWLQENESGRIVRVLDVVYLQIKFLDMLLVESHEQDGTIIQTRNALPSTCMKIKDNLPDVLEEWFQKGLQVDIAPYIETEEMPVYVPDAPHQQSLLTEAYPIHCLVQQSQGSFVIPDTEVQVYKETFAKIGLPGGKSFSTTSKDADGSSITRLWRWDKIKNWKAHATSGQKVASQIQDVSETCRKLFRDHPRAEIYQRLLLQMFEVFEAQKLTGGFSGSLVIRVQPFEADGRPGEPCIVKFDEGKAIRTEASNSKNVFKALPDRAARILGDAVYGRDKETQEEFGAMRLELAGACWNIPELAQGSSSLLSTFKDLLLYESEQMLLGSAGILKGDDMRPFGNVNSVLAETFGPGGIVSSLRKGGIGLHRNIDKPLISGWYTLKGKETKYNIFVTKKNEYAPEKEMRRLYREYFNSDVPNLKEMIVQHIRPKLEELAKLETGSHLCPLVGLAHGDLNAANIMIDALDAVWLIDFATSIELPLFTDMCKFEMACLFEYATIPITPKMLLEFASTQESSWAELNVGDWLRTDQKTAELLLQRLVALPPDRLAGLSQTELEKVIDEVASKSAKAPHKQKALQRALLARLVSDQSFTDAAFTYAATISTALLQGDTIKDSLEIRNIQLPEGRGARGAASLRFFYENLVSIRRFMLHDVMGLLREQSKKGQLAAVDSLSLQLWLPFLRESYRVIGYRDIAPQYKVWCIFHCKLVARKVLTILETIQKHIRNLSKLQQTYSIRDAILGQSNNDKVPTRRSDRHSTERAMQLTSHWVRSYSSLFPTVPASMKVVRKVHRACPKYKEEPGFFAPVFQAQLPNGEKICKLSFYDLNERGDADKAWELCLIDAKQMGNNGHTQSVKLGWVTGTKSEPEVVLSSRLVPLTDVFLRRKTEDLKDASSQEMKEILGSYLLQKWEMGNEDVRPQSKTRPVQGARNEEVDGFLCISVSVKDRGRSDVLPLEIIVGAPCYCYPSGAMLCVDPQAEVPNWAQRSPCVVVQNLTESASSYVVRGSIPLTSQEGDGLAEFEPLPGNHTYLVPVKYPVSKPILFKQHGNEANWMEGQITQAPSAENQFCHVVKFLSGEKKDKEMPLHLDGMNSGIRVTNMTCSAYEEEVSKIKGHFRARHSWIMDSLSGLRFNVKECAPPTLSTMAFLGGTTKPESMTTSMSISKLMRRSASAVSFGGSHAGGPAEPKDAMEVKSGWQTVLSAVESYNLGQPSCNPNAFFVWGSPGSGKSCFVGRLMMEMLDRYENLIPLMLPVADLVKRSDPDGPDAVDAEGVQDWFDSYLRVTYGEDSLRYSMICQARSMSRVVFLFEGLEDAEKLSKAVESLIRVLVRAKNLVVVTSRPLLSRDRYSALENESELLVTMRLENLSDEQKRIVAYARLGAAGIEAYDNLLSRLRTSQNVSDQGTQQGEEASNDGAEDVFGNPMMLSMLLCYLQTMGRRSEELEADEEKAEESEETTLTAVYRVAVDVMLQRVQSRTQGDRLLVQERVEQSKQILQKMAMAMQISRRFEIRVEEVDGMLKPELGEVWTALKTAVSAGHAMFLRMTGEAGPKEELRFLVKGFQNFFAASCIAAEGAAAEGLPDLKALLTEEHWQQMLEMLGEAWPGSYVEIVQNRLGQFKPTSRDNFLHLAARAGHRPIFQLLHKFPEQHREKLNQRGEDGMLPLHLAAQLGHTLLIELMLKAGSLINAEDAGERLAVHIAMRNNHFPTAQFLNDRWLEIYGSSKSSERRSRKAEQLAQRMVSLNEKEFLAVASETFTELGFFSQKESVDKKRTVGALLAVFWIVADQYDQFVRGQEASNRLSKNSWEHLQDWTRNTVHLTKSHSMVSAMLVYVAIMNVGKIKPFRAAFAPEEDEPTEALARILHRSPILVPSFAKLEAEQQQIILRALKADFNFGQFLQAENLPASLFTVRQILQEGGEDGAGSGDILGFFLFRIFAAMCGVAGANSLDGSIFMTETNYKNFEVGLDTLMHLMEDGAVKVYDRFLEARARNQGLNFRMDGNRDQRALVRLACMMRAFDQAAGERIQAAWLRLEDDKRNKLVQFLNADGVKITPGFLLYHAPSFLDNAKKNEGNFPLEMIFEVLLQVYEAAAKEYAKSDQKVITVMVEALAEFAKNCKHTDVFQFVKFEIARTPGQKGEVMGNLVISPWQLVVDKHLLDGFENEAGKMFIELVPQTGLKENIYLKQHLPKIFPELGFFRDQDDHTKYLLRETLGRLLVVYWTATDQPEAFTRGQEIQKKLTENSWSKIREMTATSLESPEVFNAVLTAMAILDVAKLPKFRAQLAPHCSSPTQVLADVLENWPQVLPSFVRMPQEAQSLARDCLTSEFIFAEFIWAEIPPASVTKVKTMLTASRKSLSGLMDKTKYLGVFLYCVFVEMSASQSQSLEGSLYMTEDRWKEFEVGKNAILRLEEDSEQVVYDSILARSAQAAGFTFDGSKRESRALARLACMANITDPEKGRQLEEAFDEMEEDQRVTLSTYLAADGINSNQKPAFAFQDGRLFLQKALANEQSVGPHAAILILLKVCQEVYEKYNDKSKSLLMVKLSRLATFAADFQGSVTFQDMPFALELTSDGYALVIPKVWIPVSKEDVLKRLTLQCRSLAQNVMNGIGEKRFKTMLPKSFPELAYFGSSHAKQHDQTYGALLSVYWLVNDQHEAFTREQDQNDVLSKQSWAWIQDWMSEHLRLHFEEVLDSTMVFMAIHALGKIHQFREEVAPRYANSPELHDVALASILEETPEIVPSFNRLSAKYKSLIIDSLGVDFQFSQFLQAEIVPSNLVVVKEKLQQHGEEGYSLFCFRIFAQMSGKLGDKSLHGSLFMTESQFQKFRPGLEALMQLRNMDAGPAYNAFLLLRGSKALSRFASWQHQALVRLLCLSTAYDRDSGDSVCNAFDKLSNAERASLTRWLVADGISQRPGYVLCDAPELLKNAQGNPAVGLVEALKALVRVQEMMQAADLYMLPSFGSGGPVKAYVQLRELALLAKEAGVSTQDFANVEMKVTADDHGEHRIYNVEVIRPEGLDKLYADETSRSGCRRCCNALLRCTLLLFLLILFVVPGVAAAALYFKKKKVFYYMDKIPPKKAPDYAYKALDSVQDNPHLAMYVLIAVSLVSFLGILISCCCNGARKHRPMGYDSIAERVWCCAARTTSRMGRRDDARTACCSGCSYQPLQQVESGAGEPLMPNASVQLVGR